MFGEKRRQRENMEAHIELIRLAKEQAEERRHREAVKKVGEERKKAEAALVGRTMVGGYWLYVGAAILLATVLGILAIAQCTH